MSPSTPAARPGRARYFAEGTVAVVAFVLATMLVGAVVYGLLLGLLWAYNPSSLEDEELGGIGGLLWAAWFVGFLVVGAVQAYPRASSVTLGLGLVVGGVALAVGALVRVAG